MLTSFRAWRLFSILKRHSSIKFTRSTAACEIFIIMLNIFCVCVSWAYSWIFTYAKLRRNRQKLFSHYIMSFYVCAKRKIFANVWKNFLFLVEYFPLPHKCFRDARVCWLARHFYMNEWAKRLGISFTLSHSIDPQALNSFLSRVVKFLFFIYTTINEKCLKRVREIPFDIFFINTWERKNCKKFLCQFIREKIVLIKKVIVKDMQCRQMRHRGVKNLN